MNSSRAPDRSAASRAHPAKSVQGDESLRFSARLVRYFLRKLNHKAFSRERFGNLPRPSLRWLVRCLPAPTVVWRNGIPLKPVLDNRLWVSQAVRRYHEPALDKLLSRCLRPGDVVLDVGGQVGITVGMAARRVGSEGAVHTFEPYEANRLVLEQSLRLNGIDNVVCRALALGAEAGSLRFAPEAYSGMIQRTEEESRGIEVPVTTLDQYVKENSLERVDFVKIDVDGPDFPVLLGAERLAGRSDSPFFCVECSPYWQRFGYGFSDAFAYFTSKGYSLAIAHRRGEDFVRLHELADLPAGWGREKSQAFNFCAFKEERHGHVIEALGLDSDGSSPGSGGGLPAVGKGRRDQHDAN